MEKTSSGVTRLGEAGIILRTVKSFIQSLPAATLVYGEDLLICCCNPAFTALYGFSDEELRGKHLGTVFSEDQLRSQVPLALESARSSGSWVGTGLRNRRNGEELMASIAVHRVCFAAGSPGLFVDSSSDNSAQVVQRRRSDLLDAVMAQISDHVVAFDTNGIIVYANRAVVNALGRSEGELLGRHVTEVLGPINNSEGEFTNIVDLVCTGGDWSGNVMLPCFERSMPKLHVKATVLPSLEGLPGTIVALGFEIVPESMFRSLAPEGSSKLGEIFEFSPDGVALLTVTGKIVHTNEAFRSLVGLGEAMLEGMSELDLSPQRWHEEIRSQQSRLLARGNTSFEREYRRSDGKVVPVFTTLCLIRDEAGEVRNIGLLARDITEIKESESQLKEMANTDSLTGCFNRRHFFELGGREFFRAEKGSHTLCCLMFDLDHFKQVNDTYGHEAGDDVLVGIAGLAGKSLRASDLLGRLGGEEFCILLPKTTLPGAIHVANRIRHRVQETAFSTCAGPVKITVSVGVSILDGESHKELKDLIRDADAALFEAKRQGRNRVAAAGDGKVGVVGVL
jgi:diguanylate cyclase (GGDEF)-like protein/PAS domain S-box-containing protein